MSAAIYLNQIRKSYNYKHIFQELSLKINYGEAWHIKGLNGSGKSTVLKIIAGICSYEGVCKVHTSVGYIGHRNGLYGQLTAIENMQYLTNWHTQSHNIEQGLIELNKWKIPLNKKIDELSAGQKQACALLSLYNLNKKCWILDESMQCLDEKFSLLWFNICKQHIENKGIIIFTSHIENDLILSLTTNTLRLESVKC